MNRPILEFFIPTYCRLDGAYRAAESIASQITQVRPGSIRIWVSDDASPNISDSEFYGRFAQYQEWSWIRLTRNRKNLGMSQHILSMFDAANGQFATVLTDDDRIASHSLGEIVATVESAAAQNIRSIFTPRFSFTEDGSFHCIECQPFRDRTRRIPFGPLSSVRHARNGFILTGLLLDTSLEKDLWRRNVENGYFCVINFGASLLQGDSLFVNRLWFHHTVLNETYWEAWGQTKREQALRLHSDYIKALVVIYKSCLQQQPIPWPPPPLLLLHHSISVLTYCLRVLRTMGYIGLSKALLDAYR